MQRRCSWLALFLILFILCSIAWRESGRSVQVKVGGSGIVDVSDETNFAVQVPLVITDDTVSYGPTYDVRIDGAAGDGVTDDRDAVDTAAGNAGGKTLVFPPLSDGTTAVYKISDNLTITQPIRIEPGVQISVDVGKVLTIDAPAVVPYAEVFPGEGTVTFSVNSVDYVIPQWWGAVGDGVTDDGPAFDSAVAGSVEEIRIPPGFYNIASDLDLLDKLVSMPPGSIFDIDGGITVTINGELDASTDEHFTGDGTVVFNDNGNTYVVPQWWGAVGDGVTDDGPAFDPDIAGSVEEIRVPPGFYKIASDVDLVDKIMNLPPGAVLDIDNGVTVTIGELDASTDEHFTGDGTLIFSNGGNTYVVPQWWGAVGDGVTDDGPAFNSAVAGSIEDIRIPPGFYSIATNVDLVGKMMSMAPGAVLDVGGGTTVTIGSGQLLADISQHFQGAGTIVFDGDAIMQVIPQWFGVTGDGVTDDSAAFTTAAASAAGSTLLIPAAETNYKLSDDVTIGSTVMTIFQNGALFSVDNAMTLTLNCPFEAGPYQIFSGAGSVAGAPQIDSVRPEWWGAVHGDSTDDAAAIQKAVNFAADSNVGRVVFFGSYDIQTTITVTSKDGFVLSGTGGDALSGVTGTTFLFDLDSSTHGLVLDDCRSWVIEHIRFEAGTGGMKSGLCLSGATGQTADGVVRDSYFNGPGAVEAGTAGVYFDNDVNFVLFIELLNVHIKQFDYGVYVEGSQTNGCKFLGGRYYQNGTAGIALAGQNHRIIGIDLENQDAAISQPDASTKRGWVIENIHIEAINDANAVALTALNYSRVGPAYMSSGNTGLLLTNSDRNWIQWDGDIDIENAGSTRNVIAAANTGKTITDNGTDTLHLYKLYVDSSGDVALGTGLLSADILKLNDTDDSNFLSLIWNEDDSADRILNLLVSGANRSLTLEDDSLLNQDLTDDASPTFADMELTGDITAAGGFKQPLLFKQSNISAGLTDAQIVGITVARYTMPWAGSIIGISVWSNSGRTSGTYTVEAYVNAGATGFTTTLDAVNTDSNYNTQAKDTDTFSAGDGITCRVTSTGDWLPETADVNIVIWVEM